VSFFIQQNDHKRSQIKVNQKVVEQPSIDKHIIAAVKAQYNRQCFKQKKVMHFDRVALDSMG
jgi:hypothetical protein